MKKNTKLVVSVISSLIVVILAFIPLYFVCFKDKEIKVEDLVLTKNSLQITVGDKVELDNYYNLKPINSHANVICLIENPLYATINENNVLTAKDEGNTKIYFRVKTANDFIEKDIDLSIKEKLYLPNSLSFEFDKITLDKNETKTNVMTVSKTNCEAVVSYSSKNVCEYNYKTGLITPINEGTTIVTIKFCDNESEISKSFEVCVVKNITKEIVIENLTMVNGEYECLVTVKRTKTLNLEYFENGVEVADCEFDYELLDENYQVINGASVITTPLISANKIQFKAKSEGDVIIRIFVDNLARTEIILRIKVTNG